MEALTTTFTAKRGALLSLHCVDLFADLAGIWKKGLQCYEELLSYLMLGALNVTLPGPCQPCQGSFKVRSQESPALLPGSPNFISRLVRVPDPKNTPNLF